MKRKLIESGGLDLICDNPTCNFESKNVTKDLEELSRYVGMPCPRCALPLLTLEDYKQYYGMIKLINFINRWFSWLTFFMKKRDTPKQVIVNVHEGIHIKDVEDA